MIFERHVNLKYKYGNRHFRCRGYYVNTVGKNAKKDSRAYQKINYKKIFWSYRLALEGYGYMWIEIVLNYMFLLPVGVIVPLFLRRHVLAVTIGVGFVISLTIEVVQLISCRGLFEFDDIIGNVLGVIVGYGLYCVAKRNRDDFIKI